MTPMAMDQNPPRLDSVSTPQQLPSQIPNPDGSFPATVPQPESAAPPLLGLPFLSNPETSPPQLAPQQLTEAAPQPQLRNDASDRPPSLNTDGTTAVPDPSDAQVQHQTQTRSPEPLLPAPGPAPQSPPGSSAVWKKNQGEHKAAVEPKNDVGPFVQRQSVYSSLSLPSENNWQCRNSIQQMSFSCYVIKTLISQFHLSPFAVLNNIKSEILAEKFL